MGEPYRRHDTTIFHHDIPIARCTSADDAQAVVDRLNNLERTVDHALNPPAPMKFARASKEGRTNG